MTQTRHLASIRRRSDNHLLSVRRIDPLLEMSWKTGDVDDYWNHSTAYHGWILRTGLRDDARDVLDGGCGDGFLLQRLAR